MSEMGESLDLNKVIDEFEEITRNAGEVQKQTLKGLLEQNKNTYYLQKCGLNGSSEIEDFKAKVPVVSYADIEHLIQTIVDGDNSPIITSHPIKYFSTSSGTTEGRRKSIPTVEQSIDDSVKIFQTSFAYRNRVYPIGDGCTLQFLFTSKIVMTVGGIPVAPATTSLYRSPKYKAAMESIKAMYCCPDEVVFCGDFDQTLYCILLSGLLSHDRIQYIHSTFTLTILHAFKFFEKNWEELLVDVREGVLSSKITIPSVREAMSKLLRPDPELADLIRTKCMSLQVDNWKNLLPTLFPNAKYIYTVMTGAMLPYVNKLRHYAGDLPLISFEYVCSEGWIGTNVTPTVAPEEMAYAVIPDVGYFEFLPVDNTVEDQEPVDLTEVEVGKEYEVLITNSKGFYRYKVGDVVKVMGFYNKTPLLKYMCRRNIILSLNVEKITEEDLQVCIEAAASKLSEEKLEVIDFSSLADRSTEPGHYVIFLELSGKATDRILQECCNIIDISFKEVYYISLRKRKEIGALELNVVEKGTFKKIQEEITSQGTSASQFKMPRSVPPGHEHMLSILHENVVSRFFSTCYE